MSEEYRKRLWERERLEAEADALLGKAKKPRLAKKPLPPKKPFKRYATPSQIARSQAQAAETRRLVAAKQSQPTPYVDQRLLERQAAKDAGEAIAKRFERMCDACTWRKAAYQAAASLVCPVCAKELFPDSSVLTPL